MTVNTYKLTQPKRLKVNKNGLTCHIECRAEDQQIQKESQKETEKDEKAC